ncbi:type II secretion system protein [Luedemannella helvata]|uniref:Prepilin-type N-terminal cleavage/methylation domain-containing protein n=1 Tax=Luedemannella helvata TaxID=349315 RepID=A0ABN2L1G8_9ACTN
MLNRDALRDDRGFTLTELLVAIVILGIIIVPLTNGLLAFFKHTDETTGRLSESHDIQIAAAYFAQDVASVGVRDWSATGFPLLASVEVNVAAASGRACGVAGTPAALIRLAWDDPTDASGDPRTVRAAYLVQTVDGETRLRRITCVGASTVPVSDSVLVHNLDSASVCFSAACTTAVPAVPRQINLNLTIKNRATSAPVTVTLVGQRRQT